MSRNANKVPALELEQVLIIHDPKTEIEHFIRQVTFRDADDPFGFVVPTPEKPEVNKVEESPFDAMARVFPPEPPDENESFSPLGTFGGGKGGGGAKGVTPMPPHSGAEVTVQVPLMFSPSK